MNNTYARQENFEVIKEDDPQITYTDDDSGAVLSNYTVEFRIAKSVKELYTAPEETVTNADMTFNGNVLTFRLPDSIDFGAWKYRLVFTDTDGNDFTPVYGDITVI